MSTEEGKQNNNMTPQEAKAKELVNCMNDKIISFENVRLRGEGFEMSKQCALIAVENMQENEMELLGYMTGHMGGYTYREERKKHYQSLKEEIKKL